MLTITDAAAEKIKEMASEKENPSQQMLRITYSGLACGLPQLDMALDDKINEDDIVVEDKGVKLVYSNSLEKRLDKKTLDYYNKLISKGFRVIGTKVETIRL